MSGEVWRTIFGMPANDDDQVVASLGRLIVTRMIGADLALLGLRCYVTGKPAHELERTA